MLSKAKIKLINQLSQKKYRQQTGLFIAEGHKTVEDMMGYFTTEYLYYTSDYSGNKNANESCEVTYDELKKISRLETPQNVLAVFKMPVYEGGAINPEELTLALDGIQAELKAAGVDVGAAEEVAEVVETEEKGE